MQHLLAAIIWGIVNSTMVCKTSGSPFDQRNHAPWTD